MEGKTEVDREPGRGAARGVQEKSAATPKSGRIRQPSSVERGDPFENPPDGDAVPLLARDLDHPLAEPTPSPGPPIRLDRPARTTSAPMPRRQVARQTALPSRQRSRLGLALGLVVVIIGACFAYRYFYFRQAGGKEAPAKQPERCRVNLAVDPKEASVQIDQLPAMRDDLFFDDGTSHVLFAEAPGRIARRFSFQAKTDVGIFVHLGRTLALPSSADPEPSHGELTVDYSTNAASRDEINHAFAKLDRYARCLALLGHGEGDARKGGNAAGPSNSEMSGCVQLLDEANALAPAMFQLHAAGTSYLQGALGGQSPASLHKLLAAFRTEFLAVRTDWQMQELARQGADDGQTAAWHMRRVALAAQAWLRQSRASSAVARGLKDSRAKLDESHQALLEVVEKSPKEMAQVTGADEFMKSAQDLVTLARSDAGKRPNAAAALGACRRLIAAFNALVVD